MEMRRNRRNIEEEEVIKYASPHPPPGPAAFNPISNEGGETSEQAARLPFRPLRAN